jgi:hypothetical protein
MKGVLIVMKTQHTAEDVREMFHDHVKFSGALNQEFDISVTLCVRRKFTLKYKNANSTGKLPDATFFLSLGRSCYQCVLNLYLLLFLTIFFERSFCRFRSYPVPHRGNQMKQRNWRPHNTVILKSQNSL